MILCPVFCLLIVNRTTIITLHTKAEVLSVSSDIGHEDYSIYLFVYFCVYIYIEPIWQGSRLTVYIVATFALIYCRRNKEKGSTVMKL